MPPSKTLRVLCLGDSLTKGRHIHRITDDKGGLQYDIRYRPYSLVLQYMLKVAYPGVQVEVQDDGKDGDTVAESWRGRGQFLPRLQTHVSDSPSIDEPPFNWVIILGGTNDLGDPRRPPETIYDGLKTLWDYCLSHGSKVLALTVPEMGSDTAFFEELNERRRQLNTLIKTHKQENVHVFDFSTAFPKSSLSPAVKRRRWEDDDVHFTPTGYEDMGAMIASALMSKIATSSAAATQGTSPPAARAAASSVLEQPGETVAKEIAAAVAAPMAEKPPKRYMFRDDELVFEEEGESAHPDEIGKGYVVVRHADLM